MRRFELRDGTSSKFWQVAIEGTKLRIGWGRIGTAGQEQVKAFSTASAASKAQDALVSEKQKKGYVEKTALAKAAPAKAAPAKAAKEPRAKASSARWRPRFEAMIAALRANDALEVKVATIRPPATDAQIAKAAKRFGREIPAELSAFYREMNGFTLEWRARDADDRGCADLVPIEQVFGAWPSIWFEGFEDLMVFDFFVAEALAAFRRVDAGPLQVFYHYCGEEVEPTGYGFADYLERLLESRGYWYWIHTLTPATADSKEATTFLRRAPGRFAPFNRKLFRPAAGLSRAESDEDRSAAPGLEAFEEKTFDEAAVARAVAKKGGSAIAQVGALLDHRDRTMRKRALRVLRELGKRAAALAPRVLRSGIHSGEAENALRQMVPKPDRKRFFKEELARENDLRALLVAYGADLLDGIGATDRERIEKLATAGIDSTNDEERVAASCLLELTASSSKLFAKLAIELEKAKGAGLASSLRAIGALRLYEDADAARRQLAIVTKHLNHADDAVKAAAIGSLGNLDLADKEWARLVKAARSTDPAVREAALSAIGTVSKHVRDANKLLHGVEHDPREADRVRALAARARERWLTLPMD